MQVGVAEPVQNLPNPVVAEEGRVHLQIGIDFLLGQQVGTDGLLFVRRTAVHGRQGNRRRDLGGNPVGQPHQGTQSLFQTGAAQKSAGYAAVIAGLRCFDQFLQLLLILGVQRMFGSIDHRIDEVIHLGSFDPFKVVADTHVENERALLIAQPGLEHLFKKV